MESIDLLYSTGLSALSDCDRIAARGNKNYFSPTFHEKAIMLLFIRIERSLEFSFKVSTPVK